MAKKRTVSPESGATGLGAAPVREHRKRSRNVPAAATSGATGTETVIGAAQTTAPVPNPGATAADRTPEYHEIATLAYSYWEARGCPAGSPEVDWHRAEQDLRNRRDLSFRA